VGVAAVPLFRLGPTLRPSGGEGRPGAAELRGRMLRLVGSVAVSVSGVAPLLAAVGYVAAANALIWPTVASLGLVGVIVVLQRFATDIYLVATRSDDERRQALLPVPAGVG